MLSDATKTNTTVGAQSNSVTGKFKELFRKYGALFVVFYGGLYLTTLGGMYVCFEYNVFSKATKKKIVELQETYAEFIKKVSATQPRRAKYKRPPPSPPPVEDRKGTGLTRFARALRGRCLDAGLRSDRFGLAIE